MSNKLKDVILKFFNSGFFSYSSLNTFLGGIVFPVIRSIIIFSIVGTISQEWVEFVVKLSSDLGKLLPFLILLIFKDCDITHIFLIFLQIKFGS